MPVVQKNTHTYVISSASALGDVVTIVGTVDGNPTTIQISLAMLQRCADSATIQAFLAPLMLATLPPAPQDVSTSLPVLGTFTA